jgi:exosortase family protein XrtF
MKKLFDDPIVKFLAIGSILYISWFVLYEWWIHPMKWIDTTVIDNTIFLSRKILGWMGYVTEISGDRVMRIQGTPGLFIGDSCNGLSLFALFGIFIIAFPGNALRKLIFIPAGIVLIHFLNVLRIILLAVIETHSYEWTEFNHSYTFTIIIYACIFFMWLFWINKFSGINKSSARSHE